MTRWGGITRHATQEGIVFGLSILLFVCLALFLDGFGTIGNLLSLVQAVSVVGSLGVAMAIVVIGRGVDLSLVAIMAMPSAWFVVQVQDGSAVPTAFLLALALALAVGVINGLIVAFAEVPGILVTIGTGALTYGAVQYFLVPTDVIPLPSQLDWLAALAGGRTLGIPNTVFFFLGVCGVAAAFLRATSYGRFIYAIGDNPDSARTLGLPVRPVIVAQYTLAAFIAFLVGVVLVGSVDSANTRIFNSTIIYDVILVVVLGGVGLSGGRGGIRNVIVGTLLIGILSNGMTILNMSYVAQNLTKAAILLCAILIDGVLNPRDEQVSQQGNI
ncbi:MAG: ABC transporter permease [Rhizobiaceae bacterium]|nr:ABC transporter permease [Rhizobiaceae bacterium]